MRTLLLTFAVLFTFQLKAQRLLPVLIDEENLHEEMQFPQEISDILGYDVVAMTDIDGELVLFRRNASSGSPSAFRYDNGTLTPIEESVLDEETNFRVNRVRKLDGATYICKSIMGGGQSQTVVLHDGEEWTNYGEAPLREIFDFTLFDGQLIVCGSAVEGDPCILKWEGGEWLPFDVSINDPVYAVYGQNNQLFAGGDFTTIDGETINHVARFVDSEWQEVGEGCNGRVMTMASYEGTMYFGGSFSETANGEQELPGIAALSDNSLIVPDWVVPDPALGNIINVEVINNRLYVFSGMAPNFNATSRSWAVENQVLKKHGSDIYRSAAYFNNTYFAALLGSSSYYGESVFFRELEGQLYEPLETTALRANMLAVGSQFNFDNINGSGITTKATLDEELEVGPGLLYSAGLWCAGIHEEQLYATNPKYISPGLSQPQMLTTYGPYSECYNDDYLNRYYRVWALDKEMIESHQQEFDSPSYTMPEVIANYPANGRSWCDESNILAPFVDLNDNEVYEPELGEYPLIRGDQSVFMLTNDRMAGSTDSPGLESVIEAYSFDSDNEDIDHTIFLHINLRNRSGRDYEDFRVGYWADFDIGTAYDDYVGCSPQNDYFYGYQGDDFDEPSGPFSPGYGANTPALAVKFLGQPMDGFMSYMNSSHPVNGEPFTPAHVYNYLSSIWKDGSSLLYGGEGTPFSYWEPLTETNYCFPNFPWEDSEGDWSQPTAEFIPSDQRGLGATLVGNLPDRQSTCVDFALVVSFPADSLEMFSEVEALDLRIGEVQDFYNSLPSGCYWEENPINVEEVESQKNGISVFPNPSSGFITVQGLDIDSRTEYEVYSMRGQIVATGIIQGAQEVIDFSNLQDGLYIFRLNSTDGRGESIRFVLQH